MLYENRKILREVCDKYEIEHPGINIQLIYKETEELIEWILQESFTSVLDIGTGSGCIAVCLAKYTNAQVNALDVSKEAIALASRNAQRNDVDISFLISDILTTGLKKKI